jgi:hypothetical protein
MRNILILISCIWLTSCIKDTNKAAAPTEVNAYIPVYALPNTLEQITVETAIPTLNAGKIYVYGNYIFQNELYKGFHIINNAVPASPQKVAFLKVPLSTEISIKGSYMYCNNLSDLVVFNISNPLNPVLVNRVKNAFPVIEQKYPPVSNVYFECVDESKGIVVNWIQKVITTPNCKR